MMKQKEIKKMSNSKQATKTNATEIKYRITKTSYDKISKNVSSWPQWKKNLCNQELIVSVRAKKI